jgi:hypothetical protein
MFDRLERVIYRSADMTVTSRRIKLHGHSEYALRDITAIVYDHGEQWVLEQHPDPFMRKFTLVSGIIGASALLFGPGIVLAGLTSEELSGEVGVVCAIAGVVLSVLGCGCLIAYWRLSPQTRMRRWYLDLTFYLGEEGSDTFRCVSADPLDDAVEAIEKAMWRVHRQRLVYSSRQDDDEEQDDPREGGGEGAACSRDEK